MRVRVGWGGDPCAGLQLLETDTQGEGLTLGQKLRSGTAHSGGEGETLLLCTSVRAVVISALLRFARRDRREEKDFFFSLPPAHHHPVDTELLQILPTMSSERSE